MNIYYQDEHTPTTADIRNAVTRDESDWRVAGTQFDRWIATVEAAAEQRGAEAALLCVDEPSWEHHDQTDGFPCTNCLNKAQKGIDRYRADQEGDDAN